VNKPIPLYLIGGFLGSGKTSLLNNLLSQLEGKRVALVLNDFGSIGVDSSLVPTNDGILTKELKGGQIFCSCLSGSFVQSILQFEPYHPDIVLVEASGLSKPTPLLEILSWIQEKSNHVFSYEGMLCVIDAQRYLPLSKVLMTLEEQVVFSDVFILNKIDLVDDAILVQIENTLRELQPNGKIIRTTFGKVPLDILHSQHNTNRILSLATEKYQGWGTQGRPKNVVFLPESPPSIEVLENFLKAVSNQFYRIKGFLPVVGGSTVYVSTVGSQIEIREEPYNSNTRSKGLVCIHRADFAAKDFLTENWLRIVETKPKSPSSEKE
jgi:G3E family GTPase